MSKRNTINPPNKASQQFQLQIQQQPDPIQPQQPTHKQSTPQKKTKLFKYTNQKQLSRKVSEEFQLGTMANQTNQQQGSQKQGSREEVKDPLTTSASKSKKSSNGSLSLHIEEANQIIPTVVLQSSPKGQKLITIKIPMYRTTSFMKIQTQIFILDIKKPNTPLQYQIQRRYSDFISLYQCLFYNHPGYILQPFPTKTIQSFLKIKLGVGEQQPGQKCQMIQKRMMQLQKFINFVTHHSQLANSEQLANFVVKDYEIYEDGKKRLEVFLGENKGLEKESPLKNIYSIGKSLWSTYVSKEQVQRPTSMSFGKNDLQFNIIHQTVKTHKLKLQQRHTLFTQLHQSQTQFGTFIDMPTQNDSLLKLCTKHTSGKQYCKDFALFIQVNILDALQYNIRKYEEIQKILNYRLQIWGALQNAKSQGNVERRDKLGRRLALFERNFMGDWEECFAGIEQSNKGISEKFQKQWTKHKKLMNKIWKPNKKL